MHNYSSAPLVPLALLERFDVNGPRYTSYPTADRFVEAFGPRTYADWVLKRRLGGAPRPLSLYVHLPFCASICYYCACNKVITKDHGGSAKYVRYLLKEMALLAPLLGSARATVQMHWGGGTPNFLSRVELAELAGGIRETFQFDAKGEYSIEVDPRSVAEGDMAFLAGQGFNRVSLGVQDFDPAVQRAVNRIQSEEHTLGTMRAAREAGFRSVNVDLIYGLPRQNVVGFNRTLEKVIEASPDRIALYNYAHLPTVFKPQRRIAPADLPSADAKLQLLSLAIRRLGEAGYAYIGMDHFAKPDDDLAVAQRQGRLHRNFQGYSTHADCDLIGLGISAIGQVGPTYSQNVKTLDEYYDRLDDGTLPVMRGLELTADDLVRRAMIQCLMCHFQIPIESLEIAHLIQFKKYFAQELCDLAPLQDAGLVTLDEQWLTVTPVGRYFIRNICMVFDRYLREGRERASYSKVV
ncbi:MAG: oxygen-independent coproporphyrinogen III oxidase [Betaproteobacteria bacterium]|nr:oxygen-independent coproporphyrinogen III oxidase [Betaproteobacteria bacterium]